MTWIGDYFRPLVETPAILITAKRKPNDKTMDDFEILNVLHQGTYGSLVHCRYKKNQKVFSMKIQEVHMRHEILRSSHIIQKCQHPFIAHLMCTFPTPHHVCSVFENMNGGILTEIHLNDIRVYSFFTDTYYKRCERQRVERRVCTYAAQIALALSYLQSKNIIYRTIALDSFLLDRYFKIKMFDFRYAKDNVKSGERTISIAGYSEYQAPEVSAGQGHTHKTDWYAYGVLVYKLICFEFPKQVQGEVVYPDTITPTAIDLLKRLLNSDAENRSGSSVMEHPFFEQIDFMGLYKRRWDTVYAYSFPREETHAGGFPMEITETRHLSFPTVDSSSVDNNTNADDFLKFSFTSPHFENHQTHSGKNWDWTWSKKTDPKEVLSPEAYDHFYNINATLTRKNY